MNVEKFNKKKISTLNISITSASHSTYIIFRNDQKKKEEQEKNT